MENFKKCPYCGRKLIIEDEKYCQFCEQEISHITNEEEIFPKKKRK